MLLVKYTILLALYTIMYCYTNFAIILMSIIESCSMELCAALVLAFLALDSTSFFSALFSEEACDGDGKLLLYCIV